VVIVLIRKWLQPSRFAQNIQRMQRVVSRQAVVLQALGVFTTHTPHLSPKRG
jgi:hypothetical protein